MKAMPVKDSSIQLSDGRTLAYCEWGNVEGPSVFAFHGSPGGRLWWPAQEVTTKVGVHLITVDRPGYGRSTEKLDRSIRDWESDLSQLAAELNVDRFGVVGWSGGAPYAAAIAATMPERLTGVCLTSSASLTYILESVERDDDDKRNLDSIKRQGLVPATLGFAEELRPWTDGLVANPRSLVEDDELAAGDRWVFEDSDEADGFYAAVVDALRPGPTGAATDWIALVRPWGFSTADIQFPVTLWHGAQDPRVDLGDFEAVSKALPHGHLTVWPDAGHFGTAKYWRDVLAVALG